MHYVYFLKSIDSEDLYVGCTADLRRRFEEHNHQGNTSTKNHQWRLVYYEAFSFKIDAQTRERKLKQHGKSLAMLKKRLQFSVREPKGAG